MYKVQSAAPKNIGMGIYFLFYLFFSLIFPLYAQDYFPLDQGNFWIYKTNNGNIIKTEIVGIEKFNDKDCILVESFKVEQPQNKQKEFYQKINQTIFYYGREFGEFKAYYHPPQNILEFPLENNKIWAWAGKIDESQANCQFQVSGPENIILGKNNFSCFKIILQIQDAQTKGLQLIITRWYADKIGLVKEEDEVFQGDKKINVYYELEDYKVK